MHILVVEDDEKLNSIICKYLTRHGYQTTGCLTGKQALENFYQGYFDLVISDIMMPETDGFRLAERIRLNNALIPILFITALDDFDSKKKSFTLGVDDYMVKPLDLDEMILRVGALLRRNQLNRSNELTIGSVRLVKNKMAAYVNNGEIPLQPKEFQVLYKLLSHPEKIFTRSELLDEFWGMTTDTGLRTVDVYITRLRKKFAGCTEFEIVTIHGFGYQALLNI